MVDKMMSESSESLNYIKTQQEYLNEVKHFDSKKRGAFWKILGEMFESITSYAKANKWDEDEYVDALRDATYDLKSFQEILNPKYGALCDKLEQSRLDEIEKLTEEEKTKLEPEAQIMWSNSDPKIIFDLGYDIPDYKQINLERLLETAQSYLSKPYYRSKSLDYILLKACIFQEFVQYGESIKQKICRGKKDYFGQPELYKTAKGSLKKITELNPSQDGIAFIAISLAILSPSIFMKGWSWYYAGPMLVLILWTRHKRIKKAHKELEKFTVLYDSMAEVWRTISVLPFSPAQVKQLLERSAAKGIVWNNIAFCVADRMHEDNSSVFTI
jgi:hypothetical protein